MAATSGSSEYWKSNPRKFCEYCKCWFADNKSSIEFHERGKRHQEAVQMKISELQKKGVKDANDKARFQTDIQKMEEAAMAALKEDLKRDPSLAAAYGLQIKESGCAPAPSNYKEPEPAKAPEPEKAPEPKKAPEPTVPKKKTKKKCSWKEAKSPEGFTYFWNTETSEVTWTKPDDFKPEAEPPKEEKQTAETPAAAPTPVPERPPTHPSSIPMPSGEPQSRVPAPHAERRAEKRSAPSVYGGWTTVEAEPVEEMPDLQLPPPAQPRLAPQSKPYSEPPKINFKQKTVTSLAASGKSSAGHTGIVFKKRKVNAGNMRSRDEDT